jgi:hypothetical protein
MRVANGITFRGLTGGHVRTVTAGLAGRSSRRLLRRSLHHRTGRNLLSSLHSPCPSAHGENLFAARARALTASSSRFLGTAFVSSEVRRVLDADATWSTAARNAASLTFDGLLKPLTFLTNCSAAERISSSVAGGSKLNRVLMFLHMSATSMFQSRRLQSLCPTISAGPC